MPPTSSEASVVMVAPGFPPEQPGTGGFRPAKLATYLPDFGWRAHVIAPTEASARIGEEYAGAPGTMVERVRIFDTPATRLARLRERSRADSTGASGGSDPASGQADRSEATSTRGRGGLGHLARGLLAWGDFPDHMSGWIPGAVHATIRAVRSSDASVILATAPPFSAFVVGALASRSTGCPLVVDYQDMWTLDPADPHGTIGGRFDRDPSRLRRRAMQKLERWCLSRSSHAVFCAERGMELYQQRFSDMADQMSLIEMGADPGTFEGLTGLSPEPSVLRHVGLVHLFQLPQVFALLQGVASLQQDGRDSVCVEFVGNASEASTARIREEALALGIADRVRFVDRLPHQEAVRRIVTAQANLVFDGGNTYLRPSKLGELWSSGRPVLAFAVAGGSTAREVEREGGQLVADPHPAEDVRSALLACLDAPSDASLPAVPDRHSRVDNARDFAAILDRVTGRSGVV